jgi:hypothetical protein
MTLEETIDYYQQMLDEGKTAMGTEKFIESLYNISDLDTPTGITAEKTEGIIKYPKIKPDYLRKGDIVMCYGLKHPVVLLKKEKSKSENWICLMLTSKEGAHTICKSESRFVDSYFSKMITVQAPEIKFFMGVYNNHNHLTTVYKKLKQVLL